MGFGRAGFEEWIVFWQFVHSIYSRMIVYNYVFINICISVYRIIINCIHMSFYWPVMSNSGFHFHPTVSTQTDTPALEHWKFPPTRKTGLIGSCSPQVAPKRRNGSRKGSKTCRPPASVSRRCSLHRVSVSRTASCTGWACCVAERTPRAACDAGRVKQRRNGFRWDLENYIGQSNFVRSPRTLWMKGYELAEGCYDPRATGI